MTTNSLELTPVEKAIERCWKCAEESSNRFYACAELVGMRALLSELDMSDEWWQAKLAWELAYNRMISEPMESTKRRILEPMESTARKRNEEAA